MSLIGRPFQTYHNSFNERVTPFLFGYKSHILSKSAATTISPLILAVICQVANACQAGKEDLAATLSLQIHHLLKKSPSDSIFGSSKEAPQGIEENNSQLDPK